MDGSLRAYIYMEICESYSTHNFNQRLLLYSSFMYNHCLRDNFLVGSTDVEPVIIEEDLDRL